MKNYTSWWAVLAALAIGATLALTLTYGWLRENQQPEVDIVELAIAEDPQKQLQALEGLMAQEQELTSRRRCLLTYFLLQSEHQEVRRQTLKALLGQQGLRTKALPPLKWLADDPELARQLIFASYWTPAKLRWPADQEIPSELVDLIDKENFQIKGYSQFKSKADEFPNMIDSDGAPLIFTVLNEENMNSPSDRATLSKRWATDLNDENKKAGALLAALTNTNLDHIQAALAREDDPGVRTVQYLALSIAGIEVQADPPLPPAEELAWRSLRKKQDGSLDLTIMASGLALGEPSFLELLATTPPTSATEFSQRMHLLNRFAPVLANRIGPPPSESDALIEHYQEALIALVELSSNHLRFNDTNRQFELIELVESEQGNSSEMQVPSYDCMSNDKQ